MECQLLFVQETRDSRTLLLGCAGTHTEGRVSIVSAWHWVFSFDDGMSNDLVMLVGMHGV